MSGSVGGEELKASCTHARSEYSIIENAAAIAGELLRSGNVLGNFKKPIYWKAFSFGLPATSWTVRLSKGLPRTRSEFSRFDCERISEKNVRETDGSQNGSGRREPLHIGEGPTREPERGSPQSGHPGARRPFGSLSREIDEWRWRRTWRTAARSRAIIGCFL